MQFSRSLENASKIFYILPTKWLNVVRYHFIVNELLCLSLCSLNVLFDYKYPAKQVIGGGIAEDSNE